MNFSEWFKESGMCVKSLARMAGISRNTVSNLLEGSKPYIRTVKKLVFVTKNMKKPIKTSMFPGIKIKNEKKVVVYSCCCEDCKNDMG